MATRESKWRLSNTHWDEAKRVVHRKGDRIRRYRLTRVGHLRPPEEYGYEVTLTYARRIFVHLQSVDIFKEGNRFRKYGDSTDCGSNIQSLARAHHVPSLSTIDHRRLHHKRRRVRAWLATTWHWVGYFILLAPVSFNSTCPWNLPSHSSISLQAGVKSHVQRTWFTWDESTFQFSLDLICNIRSRTCNRTESSFGLCSSFPSWVFVVVGRSKFLFGRCQWAKFLFLIISFPWFAYDSVNGAPRCTACNSPADCPPPQDCTYGIVKDYCGRDICAKVSFSS